MLGITTKLSCSPVNPESQVPSLEIVPFIRRPLQLQQAVSLCTTHRGAHALSSPTNPPTVRNAKSLLPDCRTFSTTFVLKTHYIGIPHFIALGFIVLCFLQIEGRPYTSKEITTC